MSRLLLTCASRTVSRIEDPSFGAEEQPKAARRDLKVADLVRHSLSYDLHGRGETGTFGKERVTESEEPETRESTAEAVWRPTQLWGRSCEKGPGTCRLGIWRSPLSSVDITRAEDDACLRRLTATAILR